MKTMSGTLKRLVVSVNFILLVSLVYGVAMYPAIAASEKSARVPQEASPKYPLITLEIPPFINEVGAPRVILSSLQSTVIEEFKKKNLFAGVLPSTDVLDGVLVIQGTALSWDKSEAADGSSDGMLTVSLTISQKIVSCSLNRATVNGVISAEMLRKGSVQSDHVLVKGVLGFLASVTNDE
tara:strand:+ start:2696 stop:3238 length:543 start_codon:yes stop_codon:yes gene_type:complete